ncbi:MAG: HigA family addiction module antitoxin [Bryobacteraceae bacterium]
MQSLSLPDGSFRNQIGQLRRRPSPSRKPLNGSLRQSSRGYAADRANNHKRTRSRSNLADLIEVPPNRLYQLLAGKRNVTADTALRLSQYFGMSADFWMNLQSAYELDLARQQRGKDIQRIQKRSQTAEPRPTA